MTWRIELSDTNEDLPLVAVIKAQAIWKRLTVIQRLAVAAAYPDASVIAGRKTLRCLYDRGFIEVGDVLTEAGKQVARWNLPKNGESHGA